MVDHLTTIMCAYKLLSYILTLVQFKIVKGYLYLP